MYTNLALEQQRQLAYKCPADTERSPQQALLRKNQVVVALLSLAVDVDPGNGNAWLHLSSVHHRAGDDRRTMDALTKGTEYGREDGHLVDIWNQLGTYMQDRKQWAKALHAHQRALALAEARGIETLACTSHLLLRRPRPSSASGTRSTSSARACSSPSRP